MVEDEKLDELPPYRFGDPIAAIEKLLPDGQMVLRMADGTHAVTVPAKTVERERECSTRALREWVQKAPDDDPRRPFLDLLISDARTEDFWTWIRTISPIWWRNVTTISDVLLRATRLPQKPGNFSPKQREDYFNRIRLLSEELRGMLDGTRFDYTSERELSEDELERPLHKTLYRYDDEEGHVIAFRVDEGGGMFSLDWDYPDCALTETLLKLEEWTYWDDHWGRSIFHSSAPIRQANAKGTPANYFACTVWQWFRDHGVSIPPGVLANIADVCLKTGPNEPITEDSVKKQITRFKARTKPRPPAF